MLDRSNFKWFTSLLERSQQSQRIVSDAFTMIVGLNRDIKISSHLFDHLLFFFLFLVSFGPGFMLLILCWVSLSFQFTSNPFLFLHLFLFLPICRSRCVVIRLLYTKFSLPTTQRHKRGAPSVFSTHFSSDQTLTTE